jgi:hypothetical protein
LIVSSLITSSPPTVNPPVSSVTNYVDYIECRIFPRKLRWGVKVLSKAFLIYILFSFPPIYVEDFFREMGFAVVGLEVRGVGFSPLFDYCTEVLADYIY